MVVLVDSEPNSPTKSQGAWSPRPGPSQAGSSQAPSSYYGSVQRPPEVTSIAPPPAYSQAANAPLLPGPQQKPTRRAAATKRFCRAFSIALVIVLAFGTLNHILFDGYGIVWDNHPGPEDGDIVSCSKTWPVFEDSHDQAWNETFNQAMIPGYPVFDASRSYRLPINKSLHYIIAHGSLSTGVLNIRSSDTIDPGYVDVKVVARYWTKEALSYSQICELKKPEGGVGLGIYTPSGRFSAGRGLEQRLSWVVTVTFPTAYKSVLDLNAFATNVDNFRHSIEGLRGRVHFEHLSLKGNNGGIESDGLTVSQATIATSNSKITGKFSATDSLVLKTSNGAIDTDIDITNDDTHKPSSLELGTSNTRIASRISLLTTHDQRPQPKGGHFTVKAATSNGRLDISYPDSPVNSLLDFKGETSNGSTDIGLHPAYEGTFTMSTSNGHVELHDEHPDDPSGKRRGRIVHKNGGWSPKKIAGSIFWGDEKDHDKNVETGRVVVSTSNSWARLRLL